MPVHARQQLGIALLFTVGILSPTGGAASVDRPAVVARHTVVLTNTDLWSPLSVGNGAFCFTADLTGLQTFAADYVDALPLGTFADWSWHSAPNPHGYRLEDTLVDLTAADGHVASYPIDTQSAAAEWLRANPHQFSLGRIALVLRKADGTVARIGDVTTPRQVLDLWTGQLTSDFHFDGEPVRVQTCVRADADAVAVRVESPLLRLNRLAVEVDFAYPNGAWGKTFNAWSVPERHRTEVIEATPQHLVLRRQLDETVYGCRVSVSEGQIEWHSQHKAGLTPERAGGSMECLIVFSEGPRAPVFEPAFAPHAVSAADGMQRFWTSGGAIDLSESSDSRWRELERRIVLSQYLTGIQGRGRRIPQETGLTCNSWHGKFHLEMAWWHAVHFALWGREAALERQLEWYLETLPVMRSTAARQGYAGVRWGKMLGPDGREAPSGVGPLLLWQQPHPIYFAELLYRASPSREVLERYAGMVGDTAAFMADFPVWSTERECFELGPPFISAREFSGNTHARNQNGGFELAYWRWALGQANEWRRRLGQPRITEWTHMADHLAPLPQDHGLYIEQETVRVPDGGHPCQLAAWGLLPPSANVDEATMIRTMDHVLHRWDHTKTWGWDYPLMAMTAARLGRGDWAVESLLFEAEKNTYRPNGHNYQAARLPCYLPGNGGLLAAVAMMAAGWDGAPDRPAPGFPRDGQWVVRHEGLRRLP